MINWLQDHVWMCTYIVAVLAILTFVLNFIIKHIKRKKNELETKEVKNVKVKATCNKNSSINQSAGDMTVNIKLDDRWR